MGNPPIHEFFNGAFDLLLACFTASQTLSDASKGASRETAARELLRTLIPPVARVESGDIIDSYGNRTGQLDGVVVDHRAPTLKLSPPGPALILAEGAIAVLEVKSSLQGQAEQVIETYIKASRVRPAVRRRITKVASLRKRFEAEEDDHRSIPFVVVAGRGWRRESRLESFCERLHDAVPKPKGALGLPHVLIVSLDPPRFAGASADGVQCVAFEKEQSGSTVATIWRWIVDSARRHSGPSLRTLLLRRYFQGVPDPGQAMAAREGASPGAPGVTPSEEKPSVS